MKTKPMVIKRKLRLILKEELTRKGVSYRELASITGISLSTVARLCSGDVRPAFETLEHLCNGLNCNPGDLLKLDEPK